MVILNPYRDVSDACFRWHGAPAADIDLNVFSVRVQSMEIGIDHCFIVFRVLFRVPLVNGIFRRPAVFVDLAFYALFQRRGLVHRPVVQVNTACVLVRLREIPVAVYQRRIWVVISECAVRYAADPDISLVMLPVFTCSAP